LAFLAPVLHVAAGAIDFPVEKAAVGLGLAQGGEDEARIGLALCPLGFGDDPAAARPAVERGIAEVPEPAGGPAGRGRLRLEIIREAKAELEAEAIAAAAGEIRAPGKRRKRKRIAEGRKKNGKMPAPPRSRRARASATSPIPKAACF